jgi:P-type Cu+ transporter
MGPATAPRRAGAATVDLPIEGMTCGACAARIERGLHRIDGVASASVNLAAERATVVYDPAVTGPPPSRTRSPPSATPSAPARTPPTATAGRAPACWPRPP